MSENFIRKYRLTITSSSGNQVVIENQHIEFSISLKGKSELNELDLKIYNLSQETIDVFDDIDATVKLEVGYKDNPLAVAFLGNKIACITTREPPEVITQLLAAEGVISVREGRTQQAHPEGSTVDQIIRKIIKDSMPEIKVVNSNGVGISRTYPRGYSTSGGAKEELDKICSANNLKWHISQSDTINVYPLNGNIGRKAIVITPTMIKNSPEKTTKEVSELKEDLNLPKKLGLNLTVQMNPLFTAGNLVQVQDTFNSDGTYVIDNVRHEGSFEGDPWDTELECSNYN
jgi:hypothetical protein